MRSPSRGVFPHLFCGNSLNCSFEWEKRGISLFRKKERDRLRHLGYKEKENVRKEKLRRIRFRTDKFCLDTVFTLEKEELKRV